MTKLEQFRTRVEEFLARHKMAARTLGERAVNDGGFVTRLRAGRAPRIDTVDAIETWMTDYAGHESGPEGGADRRVA